MPLVENSDHVPLPYRSMPSFFRNWVTTPIEPRVAMKANASGMPPKFAATPEKVVSIERIHRGVRSRIAA